MACPAPRLLGAALLLFGLTACTTPGSAHPTYTPPAAQPETFAAAPTTATTPAAVAAPTPASTAGAVARGSVRQPVTIPVAVPVNVTPAVRPAVYYADCAAARDAGAAPIYRGQPGYRPALDRDNDGIACEITAAQPARREASPTTAAPTTTHTIEAAPTNVRPFGPID